MLAIAGSIFLNGWGSTWSAIGHPPMQPVFADMRTVQGGLISEAQGLDARRANPGDPWARRMNYPTIWLDIGRAFKFDKETNFLAFCIAMVSVFVMSGIHLLRRHGSPHLCLGLLSSSTLLAIERGNNDLLVFCLVYVTVLQLSGRGYWLPFLLACGLKIYPASLVIAIGISRGLRPALMWALVLTIFGITGFDALVVIREATPISAGMSYGWPSVSLMFHENLIAKSAYFCGLILFVAGISVKLSSNSGLVGLSDVNDPAVRLFLAGASIYCSTYVFASNYDYRLIFLLFCLPYVLRQNGRFWRWLSLLMLLAMSFYWIHMLKTNIAVHVVEFADLQSLDWVGLYAIPWYAVDHTVKAIIFASIGGVLLMQVAHGMRRRSRASSLINAPVQIP